MELPNFVHFFVYSGNCELNWRWILVRLYASKFRTIIRAWKANILYLGARSVDAIRWLQDLFRPRRTSFVLIGRNLGSQMITKNRCKVSGALSRSLNMHELRSAVQRFSPLPKGYSYWWTWQPPWLVLRQLWIEIIAKIQFNTRSSHAGPLQCGGDPDTSVVTRITILHVHHPPAETRRRSVFRITFCKQFLSSAQVQEGG